MLTRRRFISGVMTAALASRRGIAAGMPGLSLDLRATERGRVLRAAERYLRERPVTITSYPCARSAGGRHDYYSEADYSWPDPKDPHAAYINRDGYSYPGRFTAHRHALMRLSLQMPALTAAWVLTNDERYAKHAAAHLSAWFLDKRTLMNPRLDYAQAVRNQNTGWGIGIIDTLHLVEVARAARELSRSAAFDGVEYDGVRAWFATYVDWLTGSAHGVAERDTTNNHAVCWTAQVAEFSRLSGRAGWAARCRERFKTVLLPGQMARDGSFPRELGRTKPYGYSIFNLEVMGLVCEIGSEGGGDLWEYVLPDGRSMGRGVEFLYPYLKDKSKWPYPPDVEYFDDWPVRQTSLLFGGLRLGRPEYLELWGRLNPDPTVEEVIRNFPVREPVLWVGGDKTKADPLAQALPLRSG